MAEKRIVLITGGASDIALATARHFARQSAHPVLSDVNFAELQRKAVDLDIHAVDLTDPMAIARWVAMVAERRPANFLHAVLDNEVYGSTGAQRSLSARVPLDALAAAAGYAQVERAMDRAGLDAALDRLLGAAGPSFLLIKVASEADGEAPRVALTPARIAERLRQAVTATEETWA